MKKYMKSVMKNLVAVAGSENKSGEMLKNNSYAVLNVSPRFF